MGFGVILTWIYSLKNNSIFLNILNHFILHYLDLNVNNIYNIKESIFIFGLLVV